MPNPNYIRSYLRNVAAGIVVPVAFLALAFAGEVRAQDVQSRTATLEVVTNVPDAAVIVDGTLLGTAASRYFAISRDARTLRLAVTRDNDWSLTPLDVELPPATGDTVVAAALFPYHYQVETIPYGAHVYYEAGGTRTLLGDTPLQYVTDTPMEGTLVVERNGYVTERFEPGRDVWNRRSLVLVVPQRTEEAPASTEVAWRPPPQYNRWIDYASLGLAAAAGIITVRYKFKADRLYQRYADTGDPTLRAPIDRYDARAAVSLGVMQVGVGIFAVRLALR